LLEGAFNNGLRGLRHCWRKGWSGLFAVCTQHLEWITPGERDEAGQHLVQDDSGRVQIGAAIDWLSRNLLRCQVVRCPDEGVRGRETLLGGQVSYGGCQTEVGDDRFTVRPQQNV